MAGNNSDITISKAAGDNFIPAFPAVIVEINRVIDLPETDYRTLSKIIEKDPAICAKILKIVNSAFYGMPSEVANIPDAASILGFDIVHRIALTISVLNTIKQKDNDSGFDQISLWKHLFYTASISRFISGKFKISRPDDAYVTGLLHDIGKFILYRISPEYYSKIKDISSKKRISFSSAEKLVQGYPTHSQLGAFAAEEWKFPLKLIDSIRYHHAYSKKAHSKADLILLMTSNYIDNNKDRLLNSGIEVEKLPAEVAEVIKKPLVEINYWLPDILGKTEKEFKTFAENFK